MTGISGLADLRPGDILFGPIGGAVGLGIGLGQLALGEGFHVGRLSIRHVGIVVEASVLHEGPTTYDRTTGRYFPATTPDLRQDSVALTYYPTGVQTKPRLVQAMPHGAEEIGMMVDTHWTPEHAYVRLPEDYPGQAADAAAIARLMVAEGVAYSFASYAALAAWRWGLKADRLGGWIERRRPEQRIRQRGMGMPPLEFHLPVEAICSVLVDQAWSLAGKRVMRNVAHQAVTPGAMAGQLLTRAGTVWGGPAWA